MCAPVHCAAGSDREMNFGVTGEAAPNAASSSVARYSRAARPAFVPDLLGFQSSLANRALLVGVGGDQAGIDREAIGANQALRHAASNDGLEQMPQEIALAKAAMPVLRKGRMIGDLAVESETAEPAIGEIEMNFLAQPPLGPDAHAIADSNMRIISSGSIEGRAGAAVKRLQSVRRTSSRSRCRSMPRSMMVGGHVVVEAEIIKQSGRSRLNAHHRRIPRQISKK